MGQNQIFEQTLSAGRIVITMQASTFGQDLLVSIYGGTAHIGAIALASSNGSRSVDSLPGHREGELAQTAAENLAQALARNVAVVAGIHYDAISKKEIAAVEKMIFELTEQLINSQSKDGH